MSTACAHESESEEIALDDEKADSSCPTVAVPEGMASCPSARYRPVRAHGCITRYTCAPGNPVTERFACTTTAELAGEINTFVIDLVDPETTLVDIKFADPDNPAIKTTPDDSPLNLLADQSDGSLEHRSRGLRLYSNSIDIQYTTAFFYASTGYATGWVRVEDPGDNSVGNHFARIKCTRTVVR